MGGREFGGAAMDAVVAQVMRFEKGLRDLGTDELQLAGVSLAQRVRAAEAPTSFAAQAPTSFVAEALATCGEAVRRTHGSRPSRVAVRAAAAAASGFVVAVRDDKDARCASSLAAFWFGVLGNGVHVIASDDRGARETWKFMSPAVAALGAEVGLITEETPADYRRLAYAAMITVGSRPEVAVDYQRDNLHERLDDVVQRGLAAAIVEDVDELLVDMAMHRSIITAPRTERFDEKPEDARVAVTMWRDADYRLWGEPAEVQFSRAGMRTIKRLAGWDGPARVKAVSAALRIERAVRRKERLIPAEERQTLADMSVHAFMRRYEALAGFCRHRADVSSTLMNLYGLATLHPARWFRYSLRKAKQGPDRGYVATERVLDEQRSVIDALRAGTLRADSGERMLRTWPHQATADAAMDESIERLVQNLAEQTELIRVAKLRFLDTRWWAHLERVRFLQGNVAALYDSPEDAEVCFKRDADALFVECLNEIREYTLGHLASRGERLSAPQD